MAPSTAIVTGGGSGLGYECVRALLHKGWHVAVAVRDVERGRAAADRLGEPDRCVVMRADLASLASVRTFLEEYGEASLPGVAVRATAAAPPARVHSTRTSARRLAALAREARFKAARGQYFLGLRAVESSTESSDLAKAEDLWRTTERLVLAPR